MTGRTTDPLVGNSEKFSDEWPLTWETAPPTDEGYYWYRESSLGTPAVVRVYLRPGSTVLRATGSLFEQHAVQTMDGEWAGPLPFPEE